MPSRFNASTIIFFALLSTSNAFGDDFTSSTNSSLDERYTELLLNSLKNKQAVTGLEDSKMTDLTHLIQGLFQSNTTDERQVSRVNVSIVGEYTTAEGKISHVNVSIVGDASENSSANRIAKYHIDGSVANASLVAQDNQTQTGGNMTNGSLEASKVEAQNAASAQDGGSKVEANKTVKSVEVDKVQVASLPMASFALDDTPPKTKPDQKFPGNATQKVAWESKEKSLEKEVHALKARLENASNSLESSKPLVQPVAAGTFNSNLHDGDSKAPKKFMAAKGPEPMQPIRKDDKPKADWPTMTSVAEPVAVAPHRPNAVAVPPQKDAVQAQEGDGKTLIMGGTFTGTPAKKVQSALAMDVTVDHDSIALDDNNSEKALSSSAIGWFSSLMSWFSGNPADVAEVPNPTMPSAATLQKESAALTWVKQDSSRTSQAVQEEHQRNLEVSDTWNQMEEEDTIREQKVRQQDVAERQRAASRDIPRKPTKSQLKGRHGPELGDFWSQLEKQDHSIEQTVQSDDLVKYAQLTHEQDTQVAQAGDELSDREISLHSSLKRNTDSRLAIHEPWLLREQRDKKLELEVHESKDLQMLQLRHTHERK